MLDWNEYRKELAGRLGEFSELSPGTMEGYKALSGAGKKTGHLDAKTRELIAIAVGVTTRCDGCIAVHTKAAGASREEIAEALGVAVALNAGAAMVYSARALDALGD
ncbi:MAG: carboxymuconolactone decarboxylase family protein [Comamonas sp.]|uniref:carboxymuconolactone decarboxylase family protein n=1 Tax=Comamonas sp. TaxID=34028 RepID=UPI0026480787|nr:carboxymuconolactone decarboxylase family protein [Comamonas sp.]MDN5505492.1 carboxymuconolactone decarboxylase family protein [Comamonas sp.]MDN5538529.1 carboxymuconolactone decarboxylase family protein [Comamonas sp.]